VWWTARSRTSSSRWSSGRWRTSTNPSSDRIEGAPALGALWLGRIRYADAEGRQRELVEARHAGLVADTLLLFELSPVITLGRGARPENVLIQPDERRARGIEMYEAGRGGDVTYHGPGQLVGYPILALDADRRDVRRYLRDLEEALIRVLGDFEVAAERRAGLTGVWVGERKIASIGVRVSTGWITSHGFALNVSTDLTGFSTIVPCGIRRCSMTSIAAETGVDVPLTAVAAAATARLAEVFRRPLREVSIAAGV
jgi:lipoyl(octanoyl) transferase